MLVKVEVNWLLDAEDVGKTGIAGVDKIRLRLVRQFPHILLPRPLCPLSS